MLGGGGVGYMAPGVREGKEGDQTRSKGSPNHSPHSVTGSHTSTHSFTGLQAGREKSGKDLHTKTSVRDELMEATHRFRFRFSNY